MRQLAENAQPGEDRPDDGGETHGNVHVRP